MAWNLKSDRPIYSQLIEQIQLMIVSGIYEPGSRLPSVRDLAAEASVNPNTMQRALSKLEGDGLIYSQRTSGRYVTEDVQKIMQTKQNLAADIIQEFIQKMDRLGFDTKETVHMVNRIMKEEGQNGSHT